MGRAKKPVGQTVSPPYPDREAAAIYRRKFLALVGGGAAALLAGACGDEDRAAGAGASPGERDTMLPGGKPPDLSPGPLDPQPADPPPGNRVDASADAGAGAPGEGAASTPEVKRRKRRAKRVKKKDRRLLGGEPLSPDFDL